MQESPIPFEAGCRKAGLRLTVQRLEIYRELDRATDHPSAETLHTRLLKKIPTLSLDTVYRTLATLAGHDLINKVETVESQARFEVKKDRHHHLICARCKQISDFRWPAFDAIPLPELTAWGEIRNRNVVLYGRCRNCV